jgi:ankyrin repeat protein
MHKFSIPCNIIIKQRGETALMGASSLGRTQFVEFLLVKAGVNPNLQNERGMSALMKATSRHKTEAVAMLVRAGANLDLRDKEGNSAVILAVQLRYSDILTELIQAGANPNLQNEAGLTALIIAVRRSWASDLTDTHILLARIDTNTNLQDRNGDTALIEAASRGKSDVVVELLGAGAQVDLTNTV